MSTSTTTPTEWTEEAAPEFWHGESMWTMTWVDDHDGMQRGFATVSEDEDEGFSGTVDGWGAQTWFSGSFPTPEQAMASCQSAGQKRADRAAR